MAKSAGDALTFAKAELERHQIGLLRYLVDHRRTERARAQLAIIATPPADLEILIAAQSGELTARLDRYRQDPSHAPAKDVLQNAAAQLRNKGDRVSARAVFEYLYTRALDARDMSATNFLGLAEVRLEAGDVDAAKALLRRMNLVSSEPLENLMAARLGRRFRAPRHWPRRAPLHALIRREPLPMVTPWWSTPAIVRDTYSWCTRTERSADKQLKPPRGFYALGWEWVSVSRILILLAALHAAASGKELRIGVFSLFHQSELILRAAPASALEVSVAGAVWTLEGSRTARFRACRSGVLCIAGDRVSNSQVVRVSGLRGKTEFF